MDKVNDSETVLAAFLLLNDSWSLLLAGFIEYV